MRNELQRTYRVCHTLQIVALSVCEIIHRVCVPLVSRAPMWHVQHAIHYWISEMHVRRCHVDLGT